MPKIKICGLFRERDIDFVNEAEPDYIGFVFAQSRRQVSPLQAAALRRRLIKNIIPVGVFVNAPVEDILSLYKDGVIDIAQLHGEEDEIYIANLKARCSSMPLIKAFHIGTLPEENWKASCTDYVLFDSGAGDTGNSFDWSLLPPIQTLPPWFLAGGIGCDNIAAAAACNPYGLDVSSGAETKGVKDRDKILDLVQRVRKISESNTPGSFPSIAC